MKEIEVIIKVKATNNPTTLFSRPKTYANEMFTSDNPQVGNTINSSVDGLFMYVISFDVPITENNWVYDIQTDELFQFNDSKRLFDTRHARVMATNDPKVNGEYQDHGFVRYKLQNIPTSFMDFYNDSHNVGVEYEKMKVPYAEKMDMEIYYKHPYGDCTREVPTGIYEVGLSSRQMKITKTNLLFK